MNNWLHMTAPRPRSKSTSKGVIYSGEIATRTDYLEPLRMIYDHELILYESGDFVMEFKDAPAVKCPAGSFIIIPPARMHLERSVATGPGRRHWCHFDWIYLPDTLTPLITFAPGQPRYDLCRRSPDFVPSEPLSGQLDDPETAYAHMRRIARLVQIGSEIALLEARVVLLGLLIQILAGAPSSHSDAVSTEQSLASRIRHILTGAPPEDVQPRSLPSVLESLDYSYAHLCRVFSATYGISPLQYLQSIRIARAQALLQAPALTVAEVGFRIGFNSPAYFIKIFHQHTGLTPGQFRTRYRGGAASSQ